MGLLFRLPFLLLELLVRRLLRRDRDDDVFVATPAPAPAPPRPAATPHDGPPPPSAEEALARSAARQAGRTPAPAPNLRAVGVDGHVETEDTLVESFGPADDDLGTSAGFTVDEPWDGYDGMPATAVVQRVRGSDEATKAVVRLYEQQHKARTTVLRATG
jgi:hypothetical protein